MSLSYLQFYQIIRFAGNLLLGWVLSRCLSIEAVGGIESQLLIANALSFFWILALQTRYATYQNQSVMDYVGMFYVLSVLGGLLLAVYSIFISNQWAAMGYILLYPGTVMIELLWLKTNKLKQLIYYGAFSFGGLVLIVGATAYLTHSVFFVWMAWLIVLLIRNIFVFFQLPTKRFSFSWNLLKQSIWLMLNFAIAGSAEYTDGLLIQTFMDDKALAQYRYGAREMPIFVILANAISLWTVQMMSEQNNLLDTCAMLRKKSTRYLQLGVGLSVVLFFISTPAFVWVYGAEYKNSSIIFDLLLLLLVSRFVFPNAIVTGLGKDKIRLWITIIELGLNVVSSILLYSFWGMYGIVAGTILAFWAEKAMLMIYLWRWKNLSPGQYCHLGWVVFTAVVLCGGLYLKYQLSYLWMS